MGGSHHYCPLCHGLVQVTIKPLSHPHLCVNKRDEGGDSSSGQEGNFDVWQSQGGGRTWFLTNQPGYLLQLTRYSAKRQARGKIFGFT